MYVILGIGEIMDIRKIIMSECRRRDWSAYKLAQESGIPQRTVQAFFKGTRDLSSSRAGKLCAALGLELKPKKNVKRV